MKNRFKVGDLVKAVTTFETEHCKLTAAVVVKSIYDEESSYYVLPLCCSRGRAAACRNDDNTCKATWYDDELSPI